MRKQFCFLWIIAMTGIAGTAVAQVKMGNNPTVVSPSAALELESTNKGFLLPRMTGSNRNAIVSPADGLLVHQTDSVPGLYQYKSGAWSRFRTNKDILRYTLDGTAGLGLTSATTGFYQVPGLTQTFTLTAPATVSMVADVSVWNNSATANRYGTADVALLVDGAFLSNAGYSRVTVANPMNGVQASASTTLRVVMQLPAGTHTIQVVASRVNGSSGAQLNVGANTSTMPFLSYLVIEAMPD